MPDTSTTNYNWVKPEVGGSNDTWGDKWNDNLDDIDAKIKEIEDDVAGALLASALAANTVMTKNSAAAVTAVAVAEGTVLGRRTGGEIDDITLATLKTDLGLNNVENFSRAQLETYFETVFEPIGGGGGGIAGQPLNDLLTAIAVEGITVDNILIGTGVDAVAQLPVSAFMQALLASADAPTLVAAIDGVGVTAKSIAASGYIKFKVDGEDFIMQWGTKSVTGNSAGSIVYSQPYSSFSVCVGSGGPSSTSSEGDIRVISCTTTGATLSNSSGTTATFFWIAIGK